MSRALHPLSYPVARHVRTCDPRPGRPYADYRSYKPALRVEFDRRCVYCRRIDEPSSPEGFGVDHYRPVKPFAHLEREYSNLFYACARCNSRKRNYWPARALEVTRFIPNPCDHVMSDHLKYDGAVVRTRSPAGETAVDTMDLNGEEVVAYREHYLRKVKQFRASFERTLKRVARIERALRTTTDPARIAALNAALAEAETVIRETKADLDRLGIEVAIA